MKEKPVFFFSSIVKTWYGRNRIANQTSLRLRTASTRTLIRDSWRWQNLHPNERIVDRRKRVDISRDCEYFQRSEGCVDRRGWVRLLWKNQCPPCVFTQSSRRAICIIQASKSLKPKAGIFLGFGKCPHSRTYEIGDVIVADTIARKNPKLGKLESLACSECLINVFENGKYGWTPPKYRKQAVHVGKVFQMGDFTKNERATAVAVRTSSLGG